MNASEGAGTASGGAPRPRASQKASADEAIEGLNRRLYIAWKAGDESARAAAWSLMWSHCFTKAFAACQRFARDAQTAETCANTAITDAWMGIDRQIRDGRRTWHGEVQFAGLLKAHVTYRCKDQCRALLRANKGIEEFAGVPDDDRDTKLETSAPVPPVQETDLLRPARTREACCAVITRLAARRELCRSRPALFAVVDAQLEYIRECLVETTRPGIDGRSTSLDALIDHVDFEAVEVSKSAMYSFVRTRLAINPNQLSTRIADIGELEENPRRDKSEVGSPQDE